MELMSEKWVSFRTDLILGKRKKSHGNNKPDLLNSVITGDETWVFEYNPETKTQSFEWKSYGSPRPVKARKSKLKVKVILIVFLDIQGITHFKFLPQGQAMTQTVYKEILRHLVRSVCHNRQSLWKPTDEWSITIMLCSYSPEHLSVSCRKKHCNCGTPPSLSDLAPYDFILFSKIKSVLKEINFFDIDPIKMAVTMELKKIPENAFQECFESWKR